MNKEEKKELLQKEKVIEKSTKELSGETETDQGENINKRGYLIGGSLVLMIIALLSVLLIEFYPQIKNNNQDQDGSSSLPTDEKRLDENITELESMLSGLDPNVDFVEFKDEELATLSAEDELDLTIDEIDQLFKDMEDLESEFPDFDEDDF